MNRARQLTEYLLACAGHRFDWSGCNCAHFAAAWVRLATGREALAGLPAHADVREWLRQVQRAGGVQPLVTAQLGCPPIAPAHAAVGDLVLLPGDVTGGTLGICAGSTAVCVADPGGTVHLPMAQALAAWRLAEVRG
jgi:hypothetical protein